MQNVKLSPYYGRTGEEKPLCFIKFVERHKTFEGLFKQSLKLNPFSKKHSIMPTSIITTDDLREFKLELLDEIKELLAQQAIGKIKKYLRSSEVMEMLHIGASTLVKLRTKGTLSYTKMGGCIFYDADEIQEIMEQNRVNDKLDKDV